ncbi:MAG TPA: UPF0182 family protein [Thermomicrobiales bacterium]|nr:UPF0182 family protein [Thermomicrobiales bacterium]
MSASTKRMLIATLVIVGIFIFLSFTAPFWINWLWFGSVGYRSVIVTNYVGVSLTFIVAGLLAAAVFVTNVRLAVRNTRDTTRPQEGRFSRFSQLALNWLGIVGGVVLFFLFGWASKDFWREAWLALRADSFGVQDPTFGRDVSFYVFTLPVLKGVQSGLFALVGITMVAVAFVYIVRLGVRFRSWGNVPWAMIRHLSGLGSVLLLLVAFGYLVRNYEMVFSTRGVVIGPGFTDVNIVRPMNWLMAFISLVAAIGLLSGFVLRSPRWVAGLVGGWAFLALILTPLLPIVVQRIIVEPNEFRREEQYIERNIEMTLAGFGLDTVETTELTGQDPIVASELSIDEPPLSNVRIWDYRVVQPVYQQLQSFVPYYEFGDIDVDWYTIDGQPVQVLASARELNVDGLRETARTWTNRHLAYTHGYGLVVSPVSQVNSDGWPVMMVRDIPVVGPTALTVERPEIYFGELPQDWIIINTDQPEFTGIDENMEGGGFQGTPAGSISLGNVFTRGLAALTLGDRNVFISGQLTGDSRLILTRSVVDRAERIAPFFEYDPDPYLVIADGRLVWIIDGYTSSGRFPQATRYNGTNYVRNSVKVVVDAYDGTTTFYRTGVKDPIADAYGEVYSGLFTPISEAPAAITDHLRYPEQQFRMQSEVWSTYHASSARSLYDGDDQWIVAQEEIDGNVQTVEPYFVMQQLPNETTNEFALTVPFTPGGGQTRQNMTAWFAGTADSTGQTRLRQYRYPRQVTVFGPMQIDAQIDQDPDISQQISLWNQSGTEVIRGNMMVIPVNDAMLYIQPLYLQSRDSAAAAPKLVRVIAATNERVVMRPTLEEAIAALGDDTAESVDEIETDVPDEVTEPVPDETTPVATEPSGPAAEGDLAGMTEAELANEALAAFDRGQTALQAGDWSTYGEEQERLGQVLDELAARGAVPAEPVGTPES